MNHSTTATTTTAALPDDNDAVTAVVRAVATAKDVSPLELTPIANVVDPDALESLVSSLSAGSDGTDTGVSFGYSGYLVTVDGDYDVTLTESEIEH